MLVSIEDLLKNFLRLQDPSLIFSRRMFLLYLMKIVRKPSKFLRKLITAPIVQPPDWKLPFEIMCDASDFVVGDVLGQRVDKKWNVIHYASKTLDSAQKNYATT